MANGLTPSERFVADLCEHSFLRLWTHPNPIGKEGKELCDCLVVCGPHVIIISVKDNEYRETGDITGWERWTKAAIEKSESQIAGAERWLRSSGVVTRKDGRSITLPPHDEREYHRLAVALGSRGQVPLRWGDTGKGFVHVCDEYSVGVLFTVLDTITDFTDFLMAVEALVAAGTVPLFDSGGLEDLVALYFIHGQTFDLEEDAETPTAVILGPGIWQGLLESEEFRNIQELNRESYFWDRLIDQYAAYLLTDRLFDMHSGEATDNELALVVMAKQPRAYRAVLAEAFAGFLTQPELKISARSAQGYDGSAFVFTIGSSADREARSKELFLRCMVVRAKLPGTVTAVGIAMDRPGGSNAGYSSDIVYIHIPAWDSKQDEYVKGIQEDLGYFSKTTWTAE